MGLSTSVSRWARLHATARTRRAIRRICMGTAWSQGGVRRSHRPGARVGDESSDGFRLLPRALDRLRPPKEETAPPRPSSRRRAGLPTPARKPSLIITPLPAATSRRRHQLERTLLERGVLERALHLAGAGRVSPAVVQVLGDRVERRPLGAGAVASGVARAPAASEDLHPLDRALTIRARAYLCRRRSPTGGTARDARAPAPTSGPRGRSGCSRPRTNDWRHHASPRSRPGLQEEPSQRVLSGRPRAPGQQGATI